MIKFKFVLGKRIAVFATVLASLLGLVGPFAPAAYAYPSDMSGVMFTSRRICVEGLNSPTVFPLAEAAQQFNLRSSGVLLLNYRENCAAAGYSSTQWFRVTAVSGSNGTSNCVTSSSRNHVTYWNGMNHWDRPPIFYTWPDNRGGACSDSVNSSAHLYSMAVGLGLGLRTVCGDAWNSRVMNCTDWSFDNVPWATATEGNRIAEIYQNVYGG